MNEFTRFHRAIWGVLGGVVAVLSKFFAQDIYWLRVLIDTKADAQIAGMLTLYGLLLVGLCFIGGVFAVASRENHEMKLLAIAVSAPALITTWLGGARADTSSMPRKQISEYVSPISSAQAAEMEAKVHTGTAGFWEGFKIPLGIGKDEQRYRVVVGSFKSEDAAAAKAAQLNALLSKTDPGLKASVGDKRLFNDYYPVVVGGYAVYPEARALKEKVAEKTGIEDVYLAPYQF